MADKIKHVPLRKCIGCQQMLPKESLVRVVKTEGSVMVDPVGKANGRGAYVCNNGPCLKQAIKSKRLEKVFHTQIPAEIYAKLEELAVNMEVR